jgi:cold shock CspA family protein
MRFEGKLEKWNDDRGFGFITPLRGGDPVFVHVSAFQADGRRPRIGETLSFEVEPAGDGKRRAVNVQRPGRKQLRTTHTPEPRHTGRGARPSWVGLLIAAALIVTGIYAYSNYAGGESRSTVTDNPPVSPAKLHSASPNQTFRCDGRTHCSQMTSCEEAKYFLANCAGVKMDGNGDGIPCEQQWCGRGMGR